MAGGGKVIPEGAVPSAFSDLLNISEGVKKRLGFSSDMIGKILVISEVGVGGGGGGEGKHCASTFFSGGKFGLTSSTGEGMGDRYKMEWL